MNTCSRTGCEETENLKIHSIRYNKDGTHYTRQYCTNCQHSRYMARKEFKANGSLNEIRKMVGV